MGEKKNKDINIHREWVKLFLGAFLTLFGMGIVGYGIVADPQGVIDYSVVSTFGVVLGWAGAMFGIDSHSKIKMHEQDTEFESKKNEQEKYFEIKKMELENEMARFRMERQRDAREKDNGEG